jgi:adenosine deaminase
MRQPEQYVRLPKVELHRHLEGSLRLETMLEIANQHEISLPSGIALLSRLVQVQDEDSLTFENFLAKFTTLRMFYRSPGVIERITREVIEDAARDNVKYLEIRFTPVALSRAERFPLHDVMDWVCESAEKSAAQAGIPVRLIASINRHEAVELAEQVVWLAISHRARNIVAIDLAGNEAEHPALPFLGLFNEARQAGLHITMHAGEWGGPQNIRDAIEKFSADRIGHGVRVLEDEYTTSLARERCTPFEVCLTSNYQTGVVKQLADHPAIRMIKAGLNVTLNTDDPSISQITLSNEYRVAREELHFSQETLKQCILAGAQASFLPSGEKNNLVEALTRELNQQIIS